MASEGKRHIGHSGILNPATVILMCAAFLSVLGLTILFSASIPIDSSSPYRFIERQALWMLVTVIVGLCLLKLDLEWLRKYIWLLYGLTTSLLIAVLIPGVGHWVNGSRSWIRMGGIGFQPAELAKVVLVFALAHYYSLIRHDSGTFWKGFVYPCLGIGLYMGLLLLQPDVGMALLYGIVSLCLLYLAGAKLIYLIPSVAMGFLVVVSLIWNDAARWSRLTAYMNLEAVKQGDGYQVWQALLAFGAGGIDGVGLGNGRQQLHFLPEAHNDFIFAIVGEELGLIATLAVLVVYAVMFGAGLIHLRKAPNTFHYLLAWGCVLMIAAQAVVNLGVVTGVLPTTGLPLPFISYGGSNFLAMGIFVALLMNTSIAWRQPALKRTNRKLKEID